MRESSTIPPQVLPTPLDLTTSPGWFEPSDPFNIATSHLRTTSGADITGDFSPIDEEAITEHWVHFLVRRILDKKDSVTIIDGKPGEGKSNFGLWLSALVRNELARHYKIRPELDLDRDVIYDTPNLLHRIDQSSRADPSVLLVDEGALAGFQAGAGLSEIGRAIDKGLSVCRINACTMFILHPNIKGLAPFVRNRRAEMWFHVEHRGVSTPHTITDAIDYKGNRGDGWIKAKWPWSKIYWPSLENDPIWAPYEQRKLRIVHETLVDLEMLALKFAKKEGMSPSRWEWAQDYKTPAATEEGWSQKDIERRKNRERQRKFQRNRAARLAAAREVAPNTESQRQIAAT